MGIDLHVHGAGWKLVLQGLQTQCLDCRGGQLVPDTDVTLEEGVKMGIHCRPWNSISHVVKSGGSCWYQEWSDGDGNQLVNNSVKHNSLALHASSVVGEYSTRDLLAWL